MISFTKHSFTKTTQVAAIAGLFVLAACNGRPIANAADDTYDRSTGRVVDARGNDGRLCIECGTVRDIRPVERDDGRTSGVGAVVGAIVGGVAGRQVGGGSGRDIATVAGAVGGAVVGNEVEQRRNGDDDTVYDVRVHMEDGSERVVTVADAGALRVGDPVTVNGNDITIR